MAVELLGRPPPRIAGGRFAVVDELGEGGTAAVYLAWDSQDRRWCAVKALLHGHLDDYEMRRRFSQEAEALARLEHPNVPRLYTFQPLTIPPFMALELCRNGSVMEWLRDHGPMPPALATDVMVQVCEALSAAHGLGILHRDVKPHNVLVTEDGVCKLTDFGIARIDDNTSMTATGSQIGTFSFMAPEQRSDTKSVDRRADVYSAGASLYTLLTAKTSTELFLAETDDEILRAVPAGFREVVLTATRYKPDDRYPDIRDLAAACLAALARLPASDTDFVPLVRPLPPLPDGPPQILPPGRRFPDLERSIALDSNQPTYVPAGIREEVEALMPGFSSRPSTFGDPPELAPLPFVPPSPPQRASTLGPPSLGTFAGGSTPVPLPVVAAPPVPVPERRVRWLGYGVGAGAIAVVGMVLVLGTGWMQLHGARATCDESAAALTETLRTQQDLGMALGDQRFVFERAYDGFASAPDPAAEVAAALRTVAVVDVAVEQGSTAAEGRDRVRKLHEVRDAYQRSVETWDALASRFPGSWVASIGLARHP